MKAQKIIMHIQDDVMSPRTKFGVDMWVLVISVGIIAFLVVKRHQIFNTAESWLVGVIELRLIQGFQRYLIWEKRGMLGRVTQIQFRPIGGDLSAKWLHFRPYFDQLVALNE